MTLYLRILSYIKPYMHRLLFAMVCTIMAAAGNLYIPWIIKDMIDEVLADKNGTMLNWIAASIIAIFIVRGLFWYGQNYLMSYVGQSVIIDIRAAVFKKLQRLSVSFYDKNKTGTIMSYVTNNSFISFTSSSVDGSTFTKNTAITDNRRCFLVFKF